MTKYFYAIAIALATVTACAPPVVITSEQAPTDQKTLVREIQRMLTAKGFDPGPIDGAEGAKTRSALASFQSARGLPATRGINQAAYVQLANDRSVGRSQSSASDNSSRRNTSESREAAKRAELSRNHQVVKIRSGCEGLFIPIVEKTRYQGLIPAWSMNVLNNSNNRYDVTYDITTTTRTRNVLVNNKSTSTQEKSFVSRPGGFTQFLISEVDLGGGSIVTSIDEIIVLSCKKT